MILMLLERTGNNPERICDSDTTGYGFFIKWHTIITCEERQNYNLKVKV